MSNPLLIFEDIHAAYVKKEILRGVSFAVERGEVVALLGDNGSGKSTTLKVIAGLLLPTRGRIQFDGKDITHATVHQRHKLGISYLLQGGCVFPNLTVEENLQVARMHAHDDERGHGKKLGWIFPHLADFRSTRAGLLSGGQRQMLAIETSFAQKPVLALLDEPSAGLAPSLADEILVHIAKTVTSMCAAVLLVEQNVEQAGKFAHRKIRLEYGTVIPRTEIHTV